MSGYRILHREHALPANGAAIWSVVATPVLKQATCSAASTQAGAAVEWRIWVGGSDGIVRSHTATEPSSRRATTDVLDASALTVACTHVLLGRTQPPPPAEPSATVVRATIPSGTSSDDPSGSDTAAAAAAPSSSPTPHPALGCTQVRAVRNYAGDDDAAGDLVVLSLALSGTVRLWQFAADWDEKQQQQQTESSDSGKTASADRTPPAQVVRCRAEFGVEDATGTTMVPRVVAQQVVVAVGCLDGTVVVVATGLATPNAPRDAPAAGTILECVRASRVVCLCVPQSIVAHVRECRRNSTLAKMLPNVLTRRSSPLSFAQHVGQCGIVSTAESRVASDPSGRAGGGTARRRRGHFVEHEAAPAPAAGAIREPRARRGVHARRQSARGGERRGDAVRVGRESRPATRPGPARAAGARVVDPRCAAPGRQPAVRVNRCRAAGSRVERGANVAAAAHLPTRRLGLVRQRAALQSQRGAGTAHGDGQRYGLAAILFAGKLNYNKRLVRALWFLLAANDQRQLN